MWWTLGLTVLLAAASTALFAGGRFLDGAKPELCAQRKIHERVGNKGYYFSWKDPATAKQEEDWLGARNWCRARCMDSVTLDTKEKNDWMKRKLVEEGVRYIWTSGRLCDFSKDCDARADLQPKILNGWFWSATKQRLAPSSDRIQNDWSPSGGIGRSQPDNRERLQNGAEESCLALLNNFYGDGIHWHDVACHHRKPFVCEDSDELIDYVHYHNRHLGLKQ